MRSLRNGQTGEPRICCMAAHLQPASTTRSHFAKRRRGMPDNLRITVDELRKRMEAGEDFTIVDTRNPQAWAESNEKIPEAIRVTDNLSDIPKNKPVVAYCT